MRGEEALISEVQARLVAKFAQLSPDHVARAVAEAHARFEHSRVRDFVPLLVERRAGDDLFKQTQVVSSWRTPTPVSTTPAAAAARVSFS